jgi:transposase
VENKAKELGIKVIFVDPQYTSQRCSRCGHIDKENRLTQARFVCTACGFEENADYNASQNLAIKGIDLIIEKELGAKSE